MSTIERLATYNKPETATDTGAAGALAGLPAQGPVSGEQMNAAIKAATEDLDGQAAGLEFSQVRDWVAQNKDRMTPEALKQFEIYEKTALASLREGKTGIDTDKYNKMLGDMQAALPPKYTEVPVDTSMFEDPGDGIIECGTGHDPFGGTPTNYADQSSGQAIDGLKNAQQMRELAGQGGKISGGDLMNAIGSGSGDYDGQAAGLEHDDFSKFARDYRDKLDPSAQRVMDVYDKYAQKAHAEGRTGLTPDEHAAMMKEMGEAAKPRLSDFVNQAPSAPGQGGGQTPAAGGQGPKVNAQDEGAGQALGELEGKLNERANLSLRDQLAEFFRSGKGAKVSGEEMVDTIIKGTKDYDNQAAGLEYNDIKNWSDSHKDKLSPGAQRAIEVYDKYARQAQAEGRTGLTEQEYAKMETEMRAAAEPRWTDGLSEVFQAAGWLAKNGLNKPNDAQDAGAGQAIQELDQNLALANLVDRSGKPVQIDGNQLTDAIEKGTKDLDNQAAGLEYNDFKNWANENRDHLGPSAQRVMDVYDKYARAAQANGQTGISIEDYNKMLGEMREAAKPTQAELLDQLRSLRA
jgi:predicted pyridoxine 5'-phosphate oxidase superfamily flavin-nucleotide-binding protein